MSNQPFLSIIIPVYNVEAYLPTCLDNILQQEFTDYEIILIDDGSSDDSGVICDSYVQKHGHIHCIHQRNAFILRQDRPVFSQAKVFMLLC